MEGTPVINVRNIGYGGLYTEKLEYVSEAVRTRLSRHLLREGDIVFGRKGAVDRHLYVTQQQAGWMQGSDCIRIRLLRDDLNPRFVSYALLCQNHKEWMLTQCSNKATMASLNQDVIRRIVIGFPDRHRQDDVVQTLSTYDDLIDNNRRRIQLLEQASRLLYKEWFGRLRFPGHEHVKIKEGVPDGWEKTIVGLCTSFLGRGISPNYDDEASGIVINQRCIRNGMIDMEPSRHQSREVPPNKIVRFGDVLVNSTGEGTLGRIAQVRIELEKCTVDSHVTIARPANWIPIHYFGLSLRVMETLISTLGRGATNQTELARDTIAQLPIVLPSAALADAFEETVAPISRQMCALAEKNTKLRAARDLLLPKLMNGEIAV